MPSDNIDREKDAAVHVETGDPSGEHDDGKDSPAIHVPESMQPMGLVKSLRVYKHASLICVLAAIGALSDGYQVQMSGSIVALPGFIRTFGDLQPDGEYAINPQYLALWGCESPSVTIVLLSALTDLDNSSEECVCHGRCQRWLLSRRQNWSPMDDPCRANHHGRWLYSRAARNALDTLAGCSLFRCAVSLHHHDPNSLTANRASPSVLHNAASTSTSPRWLQQRAVGRS